MGQLRNPNGYNYAPMVCGSRKEAHDWIDRYYDHLGVLVGTGEEKDPTIRGVLCILVNLDAEPHRKSGTEKNWILSETPNNLTPIFIHDELGIPYPTSITFGLRVFDKIPTKGK